MKENKQEIVRNIMALLSDIYPELSSKGLAEALSNVKLARAQVGALAAMNSPQCERVVAARRIDTVSVLNAMHTMLSTEDIETISDESMQWVLLAAEGFVERCRDYLDSKNSLAMI